MLSALGYALTPPYFSRSFSHNFPAPFVIANRPRGTCFYDSLGNQLRAQTAVTGSYNDQEKTYFDPAQAGGLQDMSTDGCALLKSVDGTYFLIDDSAGSDPAGWIRGATYYTAVKNAMSTGPETSDYALMMSGTNDATVGSPMTNAKYKQAMAKLKEFIQADFVNIQCAFVQPLHRSDNGASVNANYNIIREAQRELCEEDSWFKILPDMYDLDLLAVNDAHFSVTERQTRQPARIVKAIAYYFNKIGLTGVFGPRVTTASFYGDKMRLTVAQDGGTDFAAIPSLAEKTVSIRIGSTDFKGASVTRVDATHLDISFENIGLTDGIVNNAVIVSGTLAELSATSAEVIKDNATDARPLRSGVVSITNLHPLWDIHDLNLHLVAKTGTKTFSGSDVTVVTDRMNGSWGSAASYYPYYDESAFGGRGALTSPDATTYLLSGTAFTKSSTGWGGIVFEVPATTASNKYLLCFASSAGGTNQNAFYMTTGGALYYQQNEATGVQLLSGAADLRGTKNILIWNFRSTAAVDFYLNGNAVITIDPTGFPDFMGQDHPVQQDAGGYGRHGRL
jgi:hypothetical protein